MCSPERQQQTYPPRLTGTPLNIFLLTVSLLTLLRPVGSAELLAPRAIILYTPRYTPEAFRQKVEGKVTLTFSVDQNGVPRNPSVVTGLGYGLDEMAIEAIMSSRFYPSYQDGDPVVAPKVQHTCTFRLPNEKPSNAKPRLDGARNSTAGVTFKDDKPGAEHPRLRYKVEPNFTPAARAKNLHGSVIVSLVVTRSGYPSQLTVKQSQGSGLDEETLIAILKWRFYPALKNGQPVDFESSIEMRFHPNM